MECLEDETERVEKNHDLDIGVFLKFLGNQGEVEDCYSLYDEEVEDEEDKLEDET